MKKYENNRAKKLLLASLVVPMAISLVPVENVSASQIPTLKVYELNGSPKLEWATEMLDSNVLIQTSFENGQIRPSLLWDGWAGNQSFSNNQAYNGTTSIRIGKTTDSQGNGYDYPNTTSETSNATFGDNPFIFPDKINLSIQLKALNKSSNQAAINVLGLGGAADRFSTAQELTGISTPITYAQNVNVGQNYFYVNNPTAFKTMGHGWVIMSNGKDLSTTYEIGLITDIDVSTGKVTLDRAFNNTKSVGSEILIHQYVAPLNRIQSRNIDISNEWQTLNFNGIIDSLGIFDLNSRGVTLLIQSLASNEMYIDDLKFGYATEVEVYRDEQSVYKGFLSDFHDTTIKDNVKPNEVKNVKSSITNDFNVQFNIEKPQDNGVKTSYQIQSIANNGTRSALSNPQAVEIKADVVKYKYSISNQETGTPSIETNSLNDINIPLKSINLENDYIHIQAVDANGNLSDVSSFKLNELIDMKDIYNKIKELENSNNYEDFIDFINEVEQLYGDNLPQDVKEMLDKLGKHHGVNTSFLLLEEGEFRLTTSDINDFGKVKLTAKKQTIVSDFLNGFGVIDARGTQEGWNVSVSATPFTVETFDGFIGTPHQLPVGSLALNAVNNIEQVGQVHNSQLPTITLNQLTAIDGQNTTINLLNAEKQKGMGEFKFSFAPDALALTVDAVTAKIDTVNYPDSNTPYASTVTWDLVSGPKL